MVAEFTPHHGGGTLAVTTAVDRMDAAAAFKPIEEVLAALQREGTTMEELDYARRRTVGSYLFSVETYAGQARALGEADVLGDYMIAVQHAEKVEKVKSEDVTAFAKRWFDPVRIVKTSLPMRSER
jgi:predicted Zn-dependent peptidase